MMVLLFLHSKNEHSNNKKLLYEILNPFANDGFQLFRLKSS